MKSTYKFSPIKYRQVLTTIEKIAMINNENETNKVLNDIYKIAHTFAGRCKNPHEDWREIYDEIEKKLENY